MMRWICLHGKVGRHGSGGRSALQSTRWGNAAMSHEREREAECSACFSHSFLYIRKYTYIYRLEQEGKEGMEREES